MNKKLLRIVGTLMIVVMAFSFQFISKTDSVKAGKYIVNNPSVVKGHDYEYDEEYIISSTWDCVYFGHYYINSSNKKERIKWRVLSVNGNDAYLLADKCLYYMPYDEDYVDGKKHVWELSSIRKWLNNTFLADAFNQNEKAAIQQTDVLNKESYRADNEDTEYYYTKDYVYLLPERDAFNQEYGFDGEGDYGQEHTRMCMPTKYASGLEYDIVNEETGTVEWWLGSYVHCDCYAPTIDELGADDAMTTYCKASFGVRPVLHLNLNSDVWDYAGTVSSGILSNYYTSTESVLDKSQDDINDDIRTKFSKYYKTIDDSKDIIIPGLYRTNQTMNGKGAACNTMVPQGVCTTDKYILISAYDGSENKNINSRYKHSKHNSVVYVMNKETGRYVKTLILNDKGHVGAMAWNPDDNILYIAGSGKNVLRVNASKIDSVGDEDANYLEAEKVQVDYHPSFMTYCGGTLYIGNMPDATTGKNIIMIKCDKNCKRKGNCKTSMPNNTNGVAFQQGGNGKDYLIASLNFGRNNNSKLESYQTCINSCVTKYENPFYRSPMPCLSEDIDLCGNQLLTCFESAANYYNNGLDGGNNSKNPIDRLLASKVHKITGKKSLSQSTKSGIDSEDVEEVDSGNCGEHATYSFYDDGTLSISGYGSMNDYQSKSSIPWNSYSDQINNIVIGADIASVGEKAFLNLTNLKEVSFSQMLNNQRTFLIKSNAFKGCTNLEAVNMPDVEFDISSDAFEGCSKAEIRTDSKSATDYCDMNNVKIHNHDFKYVSTVSPTCLVDGYDIYRCECGEEDLRNTVLATDNHSYKLTDSYGNIKVYTCEHCGSQYEKYTETKTTKKTVSSKKTTPKNKKKTSIKKIKAKKKSLKITWKRIKGVKGYQIKYSLKKSFKKSKMITIKKPKVNSKTIKKLKRRKKYYIKIRTYILYSGKKIYSAWSKTKSKKTK